MQLENSLGKHQIPNPKFQTNSKSQISNHKQIPNSKFQIANKGSLKQSAKPDSDVLILEFQTLNFFVIWNL